MGADQPGDLGQIPLADGRDQRLVMVYLEQAGLDIGIFADLDQMNLAIKGSLLIQKKGVAGYSGNLQVKVAVSRDPLVDVPLGCSLLTDQSHLTQAIKVRGTSVIGSQLGRQDILGQTQGANFSNLIVIKAANDSALLIFHLHQSL